MKNAVKIVLVLTVVSLLSSGILSIADMLSNDKINQNQKRAVDSAIAKIIPEAEEVVTEGDVYKAFGKDKNILGYAFLAEGQGYGGTIKIICALSPKLDKLLGIEIIESSETPGLGARINQEWFKNQFKGLNILNKITYTKTKPSGNSQIQAITGATISSRSVVNIINKRIEEIRGRLNSLEN